MKGIEKIMLVFLGLYIAGIIVIGIAWLPFIIILGCGKFIWELVVMRPKKFHKPQSDFIGKNMKFGILILVLFLASCGNSETKKGISFDYGYTDGFTSGYNATCKNENLIIRAHPDNKHYNKGYDQGFDRGSYICKSQTLNIRKHEKVG